MDELEELRKARMSELSQQINSQYGQEAQQEAQLQKEIDALEMVVKTRLSKEALERYGNIKVVHPETAVQLLVLLGQAIQSGSIRHAITDEQLKQILVRITPKKKEFKITRR